MPKKQNAWEKMRKQKNAGLSQKLKLNKMWAVILWNFFSEPRLPFATSTTGSKRGDNLAGDVGGLSMSQRSIKPSWPAEKSCLWASCTPKLLTGLFFYISLERKDNYFLLSCLMASQNMQTLPCIHVPHSHTVINRRSTQHANTYNQIRYRTSKPLVLEKERTRERIRTWTAKTKTQYLENYVTFRRKRTPRHNQSSIQTKIHVSSQLLHKCGLPVKL